MPFPYASRDRLARELTYTQADFPGVADESDWNALLDDALESESERVEGYAGRDWRGADETAPRLVEWGVIRLARQRLAAIHEDGIAKEDLVSGAGYDYRPPSELRSEVRQAIRDANIASRYVGST